MKAPSGICLEGDFLREVSDDMLRHFKLTISMIVVAVSASCTFSQITPEGAVGSPDETLFRGDNLIITEGTEAKFQKLSVVNKKSCFETIDRKLYQTLAKLGVSAETKYFIVTNDHATLTRHEPFKLQMSKENFTALDSTALREFDARIGLVHSQVIYLIERNDFRYLLSIGLNPGASGYGSYYRVHTALSLFAPRPLLKFDSISDDPRKVKIDRSGNLFYVQIETLGLGAIPTSAEKRMPVTVRLVNSTVKDLGKENFSWTCSNLDEENLVN
jgi:hypothetical protein